jgi:hypothetical protein
VVGAHDNSPDGAKVRTILGESYDSYVSLWRDREEARKEELARQEKMRQEKARQEWIRREREREQRERIEQEMRHEYEPVE